MEPPPLRWPLALPLVWRTALLLPPPPSPPCHPALVTLRAGVRRCLVVPWVCLSCVPQAKGWALDLSGGEMASEDGYSYFGVNVGVTPEGLQHADDIIDIVLQYVRMLQETGPQVRVAMGCSALAAAALWNGGGGECTCSVHACSWGIPNATEDQQVYSDIRDMPVLQSAAGKASSAGKGGVPGSCGPPSGSSCHVDRPSRAPRRRYPLCRWVDRVLELGCRNGCSTRCAPSPTPPSGSSPSRPQCPSAPTWPKTCTRA